MLHFRRKVDHSRRRKNGATKIIGNGFIIIEYEEPFEFGRKFGQRFE